MGSSRRCRRTAVFSVAFCAGLAAMGAGGAGATSDEADRARGFSWTTIQPVDGVDTLLEAVSVGLGEQSILVGSLSSPHGVTMAFLIPSSGEGLVTSTWITSDLFPDGPLMAWSDGRCLTIETRRQRAPSLLFANAPWLGWALRSIDAELLTAAQDATAAAWAIREMVGMAEELGVGPGTRDQALEVEWAPRQRGGEPPAALEEHWERVVGRFVDTRTYLQRLSGLGAPAAGP